MDYCTWFPEGWWADCCQAHDLAYAAQVGKELADAALFQCVSASASAPVMAAASAVAGGLMWLGVRVFGRRFYKKADPK